MRISDWSSDVCSSDLLDRVGRDRRERLLDIPGAAGLGITEPAHHRAEAVDRRCFRDWGHPLRLLSLSVIIYLMGNHGSTVGDHGRYRSEERRVGTEGVWTGRYGGVPEY